MNNFQFSMENPIGSLKEYSDKNNLKQPNYELLGSTGPDHSKKFKMCCIFNEYRAEASSKTVKDAKKQSALNVIELINSNFLVHNNDSSTNIAIPEKNYIGIMNEICAKSRYNQPIYNDEEENPNNLLQRFTISCYISELNIKEFGTAQTKKQAKHLAAQKLYDKYNSVIAEENKTTLKAPSALQGIHDNKRARLPTTNGFSELSEITPVTTPEASPRHNFIRLSPNGIAPQIREFSSYAAISELGEIKKERLTTPDASPKHSNIIRDPIIIREHTKKEKKIIIRSEKSNGVEDSYPETASLLEINEDGTDHLEKFLKHIPTFLEQDQSEMKKYLTFSELHNTFRHNNSAGSIEQIKSITLNPEDLNNNEEVNKTYKTLENVLKIKTKLIITTTENEEIARNKYTAKLRLTLDYNPSQLEFIEEANAVDEAERLVKIRAIDFFKVMLHDTD